MSQINNGTQQKENSNILKILEQLIIVLLILAILAIVKGSMLKNLIQYQIGNLTDLCRPLLISIL